MSASCGHTTTFDGTSASYRRRLWAVIFINAGMFIIEMLAGHAARSQALQADALDFFADAATYGLSLAVIGAAPRIRSGAALVKALSLLAMGAWVGGATLWRLWIGGVPEAATMGIVGALALAANVASVLILVAYKDGDANVRSVWLCSRNDAIGNVAVMVAALGVWSASSGWPDIAVAAVMAGLFLTSAVSILRQSLAELRAPATGGATMASGHDHGHDHGHAHR